MKRLLANKKGDEGGISAFLIWTVLIIIAAVLIGLYFSGTLDFIFEKKDLIPGQALDTIVSGCEIAISAGSGGVSNFCLVFKEASKTEYITCQDSRVITILTERDLVPPNCFGLDTQINEGKKTVCAGISDSKKDDVTVGGETCEVIEARITSPSTTTTISEGQSTSFSLGGQNYGLRAVSVDADKAEIRVSVGSGANEDIEGAVIERSDLIGVEFDIGGATIKDVVVRILSINQDATQVTLQITQKQSV